MVHVEDTQTRLAFIQHHGIAALSLNVVISQNVEFFENALLVELPPGSFIDEESLRVLGGLGQSGWNGLVVGERRLF